MTKTLTFVKQLEEKFESLETARGSEPATLAEHVSNELMTTMPRISPELFERKRQARVQLSQDQIKAMNPAFKTAMNAYFGTLANTVDNIVLSEARGEIPTFVYAHHEETQRTWKDAARAIFELKSDFCKNMERDLNPDYKMKEYDSEGNLVRNKAVSGGYKTGYVLAKDTLHEIKGTLNVTWEAPSKLDIVVKTPAIPESFIELGDEAVGEYYDVARRAPSRLRKKTKLVSPRIGVLWSPTDESLYVCGKIPKLKTIPSLPSGDPALILDIPDGDKSYKHVVAVWDIGGEYPIRNWLAEFSEGGGSR